MRKPDWRNAEDYLYCHELTAAQWAWEFLRRNPVYQHDWAWFISAWEQLEARYGKPPERDFLAWQRDPLAFRKVDDDTGDCRIDEDHVLIECWMGARWGFYKFPLDPATDRPVIGEQLSWRPVDEDSRFLDSGDMAYLGEDVAKAALGFDLDLPLRPQLEAAKLALKRRQAHLRRTGQLQMRTVSGLHEKWTLLARLLDAQQAGETLSAAGSLLAPSAGPDDLQVLLQEAVGLRDGGYRQLARLPEGRPK